MTNGEIRMTKVGRMIRRASAFLKRNAAAIVLAACVGALMIAPQVAFRVSMGSAYRGIGLIMVQDATDAAWYRAVIHEALEGGRPWNAILAEHKDGGYPVPDLAERIIALPGRVFHAGPDAVLLAWGFLLPALLTLVIYAVGLRLTSSRPFSAVAALIVMCASPFLYDPAATFAALAGSGPPFVFTIFDRPVHPQFDAPFIWLFLLVAALAAATPSRRRYWIAAGLIVGFLMYSYFWAWTWGYAAFAILLIVAAVRKHPKAASAILKAWALAFAIGVPKLIASASATFSTAGSGYAERLGLSIGNVAGLFSSLSIRLLAPSLVAGAAFLLVRRRLTPIQRTVVIVGLGASVVAISQHVITRVMFNPDHYAALVGAPFAFWVLVLCTWAALKDAPRRIAAIVAIVACVLSVAGMTGVQSRLFQEGRGYAADLQSFADVASWLNAHADRGTVVYANERTGLLVPAYTPANLWWHSYAMAVPTTEPARFDLAANVWFLEHRLTADDVRRLAREWPMNLAHFWTMTPVYECRLAMVSRELDHWVASFEAFRQGMTLPRAIRQYRIDYILHDNAEDLWDPKEFGVLDPVVWNGRFSLYPMRP